MNRIAVSVFNSVWTNLYNSLIYSADHSINKEVPIDNFNENGVRPNIVDGMSNLVYRCVNRSIRTTISDHSKATLNEKLIHPHLIRIQKQLKETVD